MIERPTVSLHAPHESIAISEHILTRQAAFAAVDAFGRSVSLARPGQGRSGGFRVLIAYRAKTRSVFLFGFAKSGRGNVSDDELATAQDIARLWLEADGKALAMALSEGIIQEVSDGKEEEG